MKDLSLKYGFKYNWEGHFTSLGVPYGSREYVNAFMVNRIKYIFKKIEHIKLIKSSFSKHNLWRKLYDCNKIIYSLKVIDKYDEWMNELNKLHHLISKLVLVGVSIRKTTWFQISMSQKKGCIGLRNPNDYKWAAELSALEGKKEIISKYFTFMNTSYNYERFYDVIKDLAEVAEIIGIPEAVTRFNVSFNITKLRELKQMVINQTHPNVFSVAVWERLRKRWYELRKQFLYLNIFQASDDRVLNLVEVYDECINDYAVHHNNMIIGFNKMVGETYAYDKNEYRSHNQLLELMDKKYLEEFLRVADEYDKARITCLQNNGTMTWLNIAHNEKWSVVYTNNQMYCLLSLILGGRIWQHSAPKCTKCNKLMDLYWYHALSCPDGKGTKNRHDKLCDFLFLLVKKAGFDAVQEARYEHDEKTGDWVRRKERPGDILIKNWQFSDDNIGNYYIDLTVANVFAKSNVKKAAKRLAIAAEYAKAKCEKYRNNISGFGLEVLGGMSKEMKALFQIMASNLEMKTDIAQSIWMNRIRSQFYAHLMLENVLMIQRAGLNVRHFEYDTNIIDWDN